MEKKKLNIVFLSMYSGNVSRGVETYVHELCNRLQKRGNNVTVIQGGRMISGSRYKTISINIDIDWENSNRFPPFVSYWSNLVRKFTNKALAHVPKDTDVIVVTNGQWQTLLGKIWAVRNNKKFVVAGQSGPGLDDRFNIMFFPDSFVAISESGFKKAGTDNPFSRRDLIPNGVDLREFSPKGKTLKLSIEKPVILAVGALVEAKRLDLVIKAVATIPDVSLLIVGDGHLKDKLTNLGNKLLPGRFEIRSFKHAEMSEVYRSADLFTLVPERSEGFGIVFVEALATNLPIVTINDQTRRDIVGDAGLFVDKPTDTITYAEVIKKALLTKWGNKPRKQAEKFDWDEIALKYEKVFLDIVQK